jgi:protein phosphatase
LRRAAAPPQRDFLFLPMRVSWAARTHTGLRRPTNEDSYGVRPDLGLFIVADGMGGHVAGEVASRLAVESIQQALDERAAVGAPPQGAPGPVEPSALEPAFRLANRRIAEAIDRQGHLRGMATTASAVLVGPHGATVAHVGDSRVYWLHAGRFVRVTHDHSWVEEQVRAGVLDEAAAIRHPWRNVVTRALSGSDDRAPDLFTLPVAPGDRLLLCSDGLTSVVDDERIEAIVAGPGDLESICDRLVAEANAAGGPDNITVIVLEFHVA